MRLVFLCIIATAPIALGAPPAYDHVVIVVEENHGYSQITSTYASSAPYINNTLIGQGASFTKFYGEEHNSEGNYLWMFSGSNFNIGFGDPCPVGPFSATNLGASLIGAGYSFKGYSEDLPSIGSTVCTSGNYARKHNPWVDFSNVPNGTTVATSSNLRMTDFPSDYSTLPTVAIVVPNLNNDMHNGTNPTTVATGDTWLQNHLDGYYQWASTHNSLLIVTFDENSTTTQGLTNPATGANQIETVFAGPGIAHANYAEGYGLTHVNMLRTLEDMYGLAHAGAQQSKATAAGISDNAISDVFVQWNVDAPGNWFTAGNWNQGAIPSGIGAVANFLGAISAPRSVTVDYPVSLNTINFDNVVYGYSLDGSATLTLDAVAGYSAKINLSSGNHFITAPLALNVNTTLQISAASNLTISNLQASNAALTKSGAGTAIVNNVRAAALQVSAGVVIVSANGTDSGASSVATLSIAGDAAPTATLDLSDNALVVNYTATSPLATIQSQLNSAYANGSWTGKGITSGNAQLAVGSAHLTAVGYAEASDIIDTFPATFAGQTVDATSALIRYTLAGDANLDQIVDTIDFNFLAAHFAQSYQGWAQGDFDYNTVVDTSDFNLLAVNFGQLLEISTIVQSVPEPASVILVILATSAASCARKRKD
jgi:hypothetical protein